MSLNKPVQKDASHFWPTAFSPIALIPTVKEIGTLHSTLTNTWLKERVELYLHPNMHLYNAILTERPCRDTHSEMQQISYLQYFRNETLMMPLPHKGQYRSADKSLVRLPSLSNVFSVQGTGGSPTGPDPENRVGDQDI
jgi:hypothetical protein